MKKFHIRQEYRDIAGLILSVIGFVLTMLCLVGCLRPSARGLYFLKVTDRVDSGNSVSIYYGWQGYCIQEAQLNCYSDRSIMIVPFDVSIVNQLNSSYPRLFKDKIEQDTDLNPGAAPSPPHDPKIFPAAVLCLLCSAALLVFCFTKIMAVARYQDEYYTRGFLAWGAGILALLLVILSSVMYQAAITQLNLAYPHLLATQGPGMTMIGCAFAAFILTGYILLRGCMRIESDGYNPI